MRMIKKLSEEIRCNIREARDKIGEAYKWRDKDKAIADWYKDMAASHLKFNEMGHSNATRIIADAKTKMADNPLIPGMIAIYEEMHSDIMRESAEVAAMISAYK